MVPVDEKVKPATVPTTGVKPEEVARFKTKVGVRHAPETVALVLAAVLITEIMSAMAVFSDWQFWG